MSIYDTKCRFCVRKIDDLSMEAGENVLKLEMCNLSLSELFVFQIFKKIIRPVQNDIFLYFAQVY